MSDELNTGSIGFGDSPELIEKLGELQAGEEITINQRIKVRANEGEILDYDIIEIITEAGAEEVTDESQENDGGGPVAVVLNRGDKPAR
jgi:hypothetical protein